MEFIPYDLSNAIFTTVFAEKQRGIPEIQAESFCK